jgi:uncharacterized protein (DUF2141 family)
MRISHTAPYPHAYRYRSWLAATLLSGMLGTACAAEVQMVVNLHGVRDGNGQLRVSLYDQADSFRKEDKALQVLTQAAKQGDARFVFSALPPGRYAVMAYHDENTDNKLNLRFGMFPTEGYGLSNNPKVMGPPKFADSAFEISAPESTIDIQLNY